MAKGPLSAKPMYVPGDMFARRYRVEALLGSGFQAEVYSVKNEHTRARMALKLLKAKHQNSAEYVQRFLQEAGQLSHLNHPNIVRVFDAGIEETGEVWMLMELLDGRSLRVVGHKIGAFSVPLALEIVREIALALAVVHEKTVIHRDLKPENVMITTTGVKVLDFGIAKVYGSAVPTTDRKLRTLGTIAYMAPEQVASHPPDLRVDIYAAGLMLYELLAGRHPWSEWLGDAMELGKRHMFHPPPPLEETAPQAPPYVREVVMRCLEKDRTLRPSASELARSLEDALRRFEKDVASQTIAFFAPAHERSLWDVMLASSPLRHPPISAAESSAQAGFVAASQASGPVSSGSMQTAQRAPLGTVPMKPVRPMDVAPAAVHAEALSATELGRQARAAAAAGSVQQRPGAPTQRSEPDVSATPRAREATPVRTQAMHHTPLTTPAPVAATVDEAPLQLGADANVPTRGVSVRVLAFSIALLVPIAAGVTWLALPEREGTDAAAAEPSDGGDGEGETSAGDGEQPTATSSSHVDATQAAASSATSSTPTADGLVDATDAKSPGAPNDALQGAGAGGPGLTGPQPTSTSALGGPPPPASGASAAPTGGADQALPPPPPGIVDPW